MNDSVAQIVEELDAFCPAWRTKYAYISEVLDAAGLQVKGENLRCNVDGVHIPDYIGIAKREFEAYRCPASLPFGYDNLGCIEDTVDASA